MPMGGRTWIPGQPMLTAQFYFEVAEPVNIGRARKNPQINAFVGRGSVQVQTGEKKFVTHLPHQRENLILLGGPD